MMILTAQLPDNPLGEHGYSIMCRPPIDLCDASLFFDTGFLNFINGLSPFPFRHTGIYTENSFDLCFPPFRVSFFLDRKPSQTPWALVYRCFCQRPYSLFCRALVTYLIARWREAIVRHVTHVPLLHPVSIRAYSRRRAGHCQRCTLLTPTKILQAVVSLQYQGQGLVVYRLKDNKIRVGIPKGARDYLYIPCFLKTLHNFPHPIQVYYY